MELLGEEINFVDVNDSINFVDGVIKPVTRVPATNPEDGYWFSSKNFYTDYTGSAITCDGGKLISGKVELYGCKVDNRDLLTIMKMMYQH